METADPPVLPRNHPLVMPEDIVYTTLHEKNALQSSLDICRILSTPEFMRRWVNYILHSRPRGPLGNCGANVAVDYITRVIEVILTEDLNFEIICTVGFKDTWKIHPFGFACNYLSFPATLFDDCPAMLAAIQRTVLVEHGNTTSPVYSSEGGAYARPTAVATMARVCFSGFAYKNLLDLHFPRLQFVACFCAQLCANARYVDMKREIDVDRVLEIDDPLEDVAKTRQLRYAESESVAARILLRIAFDRVCGGFTQRMGKVVESRDDIAKNGRIQETSSYRQTLSEAHASVVRRIEFFGDALCVLRDHCVAANGKFTPKDFTACWLKFHYDVAETLEARQPIKIPRIY